MELKKRNYDDCEVTFVCESFDTRHGFGHKVQIFIDGNPVWHGENKSYYLNRTWERFRYETCMLGAVRNVLEDCKEELKTEFKFEKGISRLTAKYKDEFDDYLYSDSNYRFFYDLYTDIRDTDYWF